MRYRLADLVGGGRGRGWWYKRGISWPGLVLVKGSQASPPSPLIGLTKPDRGQSA